MPTGFVDTGVIERFLNTVTGVMAIPATIAKWTVLPILNLFSTTVDEAGERGLFIATSARYVLYFSVLFPNPYVFRVVSPP
jgi:hypothetical protein